ncbi:hypothetical protein C2G38_2169247 [Gigaspora rosea]|uniref:Uncharacterized protein n=1 Tax=Gigaspora rosea TaxID=44941 RepID=A0A397VQF8_9GLOM|nr:hypothetical protein C2G38_2169247 [Gigaspora rosea]
MRPPTQLPVRRRTQRKPNDDTNDDTNCNNSDGTMKDNNKLNKWIKKIKKLVSKKGKRRKRRVEKDFFLGLALRVEDFVTIEYVHNSYTLYNSGTRGISLWAFQNFTKKWKIQLTPPKDQQCLLRPNWEDTQTLETYLRKERITYEIYQEERKIINNSPLSIKSLNEFYIQEYESVFLIDTEIKEAIQQWVEKEKKKEVESEVVKDNENEKNTNINNNIIDNNENSSNSES